MLVWCLQTPPLKNVQKVKYEDKLYPNTLLVTKKCNMVGLVEKLDLGSFKAGVLVVLAPAEVL